MSNRVKLDRRQQKQLSQLQRRSVATRKANQEPFPGPLADAFVAGPTKICGLEIRPMVATDFILLRQVDSPLIKQSIASVEYLQKKRAGLLKKDAPPPKTDYEDQDVYETIYQFTVPVHQARAELAQGRAHFRELALRAIGDKLTLAQVKPVMDAIALNYLAAFSTAIAHSAPAGDEQETVFRGTPADQKMGSAGGSLTSPVSAKEIRARSNS